MRILPLLTCLLPLLAVLAAGAGATEIYRWVDEQGNVIFSDVPRPGAKKVEVGEVSTVPGQPVPAPSRKPMEAAAPRYTRLGIASPEDEATIRNQQHLNVEVVSDPALDGGAGHRVQFYLDGERYGQPVEGTSIVVQPIYRGTHQVGAAIVDARGKELVRAAPITIYVHQASLLIPGPAGRAPSGS